MIDIPLVCARSTAQFLRYQIAQNLKGMVSTGIYLLPFLVALKGKKYNVLRIL